MKITREQSPISAFSEDFRLLLEKHEISRVVLQNHDELEEGYVLGIGEDDTLFIFPRNRCPCCNPSGGDDD